MCVYERVRERESERVFKVTSTYHGVTMASERVHSISVVVTRPRSIYVLTKTLTSTRTWLNASVKGSLWFCSATVKVGHHTPLSEPHLEQLEISEIITFLSVYLWRVYCLCVLYSRSMFKIVSPAIFLRHWSSSICILPLLNIGKGNLMSSRRFCSAV